MANCCEYQLKAVAKSKEALERFYGILKYRDGEYFLYRVQYADMCEKPSEAANGLWEMYVVGDVAWGPSPWFNDEENTEEIHEETGSHYANLKVVCKALGIGVEVWAREPGMGFQSYIRVAPNGEGMMEDREWEYVYEDDDEDCEEPTGETGGFDDWGQYLPNETLIKPYEE